jgi:NAD(P)-dependent dehydrogenase (short-subunit alcohol dehydrogenase family)
MGRLDGKVAVVTGAGRGIGRGEALLLAAEGASVVVNDVDRDAAQAVVDEIAAAGGKGLANSDDVSTWSGGADVVRAAVEELGGLDILVNNAGLMLLGPVTDQTPEDWRSMVDVNLMGLLYCTHAALPLIAENGGGDIVNVSSVAGRRAAAGAAVYNMTKFGVHAFSEALR